MLTHDPGASSRKDRAAYWARRMYEGTEPMSDADHVEFTGWLLESPENERAFRQSVTTIVAITDLPAAQRSALVSRSTQERFENDAGRKRRNVLKIALAAGVAVVFVGTGVLVQQGRVASNTHITRTGETRTVDFNEGSVAHLNTRTELRWTGSDELRRVELVDGEALFDVAHDARRPFSVFVDNSEIRVLGTRFNVYRKRTGDVLVTVLEGTVEVRGFDNDANTQWVRRVTANEQIEYRPIGLVSEPRRTDPLLAVKWRDGVFQLPEEGAPLATVVDELTRYTDQKIVISDPRLAAIPVGGSFNTRDVREALRKLETLDDIQVQEGPGLYRLTYRERTRKGN